ncbi:hypothetical protein DOTSEDRAFT_26541 [Dothistroma septosporum NZE10]|uniref:Uncharacterized protein n=1 Tax=Dothistroma septosporum (strain NZE10 / CBS 128990) TaxID=675120 RepID=N1PIJ5_DOTSN|nr:hypothetical protein DOTSEDRAFT_26541 [Dothistroma septosporum NZE10]
MSLSTTATTTGPIRLDTSHEYFKSGSSGGAIESEPSIKAEQSVESAASYEYEADILNITPDPIDLDNDSDSELSSVPSAFDEDEHGLSSVPSNLTSPKLFVLIFDSDFEFPLEDSDEEPNGPPTPPSSRRENDPFVLDPIVSITAPAFGSILTYNLSSPLCDADDLLRLASQQTVQEITDSCHQLRPWSITRREVHSKIQEALKRVAKARDLKVKVVLGELEEAKRENGVVARERGRQRRKSGDEVVVGFSPAGFGAEE